jgi:hypothetical protein
MQLRFQPSLAPLTSCSRQVVNTNRQTRSTAQQLEIALKFNVLFVMPA